jgi:signal transduction histidine kinase
MADAFMELMDPNKLLLIEEKRKAEEARIAFLRYVFHEVRVPLNSVSLGIQLLTESDHLVAEDKETVDTMREATGFMTETLNDVLSLQKIEEGKLHLDMRPFKPAGLVRSVVSNFRSLFESKYITVTATIDEDVPEELLGDQFRLEHVLGNLLSNAIKFSDPDSIIRIHVYKDTSEDRASNILSHFTLSLLISHIALILLYNSVCDIIGEG